MNAEALRNLLLSETNVLLYGPPGTGKTHLVQELANLLEGDGVAPITYLDTSLENNFLTTFGGWKCKVFWVTFHQSYSYDDFVIGLRPKLEAENPLALKPEPGILLQAAAHAQSAGQASLIVIDEINRGNVGQVFGDFITIMEPDKRLADSGKPTQSTVFVTLPYAVRGESIEVGLEGSSATLPSPFAMPRRVFTLATMNSVDRSAAPLDAAIRRRFRVVNLDVSRESIARILGLAPDSVKIGAANLDSVLGVKTLAAYLLGEFNTRIEWFLGRDFRLGQWYLAPLAQVEKRDEAINALADIWSGRIWPQLEESFALRPDQLVVLLGIEPSDTAGVLRLSTPPETAVDVGASPVPSFETSSSAVEVSEALMTIAERLSVA